MTTTLFDENKTKLNRNRFCRENVSWLVNGVSMIAEHCLLFESFIDFSFKDINFTVFFFLGSMHFKFNFIMNSFDE